MIRLVATDLDGTLLQPDGTLPWDTFEVIEALENKGTQFIAASGRQLCNLRRLFKPVSQKINYICDNGAINAIAGEVFNVNPLPTELGRAVIRDMQSLHLHMLISGRHTCYLDIKDREFNDTILYGLRNTVTLVDDLTDIPESYLKLSGLCYEGIDEAALHLSQNWGDKLNATKSGFGWFDLSLSDKGTGIKAIADKLNIPLCDIAAFGDQRNDESMLDVVGHPYIMETGDAAMQKPQYARCRNVLSTLRSFLAQS